MFELDNPRLAMPNGWSMVPTGPAFPGIHPFDTEARLIEGATAAASELVQLAGVWTYDLHPADAWVEPKVNGIRAFFKGGRDPALISREGAPLGCAAHCMATLLALEEAYGKPMCFDAEFHVPGADAPNPTMAAFRRNRPALDGTMWLFDAVPLDQWRTAGLTAPLIHRKDLLVATAAKIERPQVGVVLGIRLTARETMLMAESFWSRRFEGIVIKDARSSYQRGRSNSWLKLKQRN